MVFSFGLSTQKFGWENRTYVFSLENVFPGVFYQNPVLSFQKHGFLGQVDSLCP
jgi:hypothetical protein